MERGEVAIIAGQFLALALLILLLGNYAGISASTTTSVGTAYWGPPSSGVAIVKDGLSTEKANSSTISVYFTLASSTSLASVTAVRLCLSPSANNTGQELVYTNIPISYDAQKHQNYVSFGPTDQPNGIGCYYTVTLSDTLQQVVTWTGTVKVAP